MISELIEGIRRSIRTGREWTEEYDSGRLWQRGCKSNPSRGNTRDPTPANLIGKIAQTGGQSCGETEPGSEAGYGVRPGFRFNADTQQDRGKIGIDSTTFAGAQDAPGSIYQVEILRFRHLQDAAALKIRRNGT